MSEEFVQINKIHYNVDNWVFLHLLAESPVSHKLHRVICYNHGNISTKEIVEISKNFA